MSLTEKLDRKAYPVLLAEIVLMAAAIQISIFFESGLSNLKLLIITAAMIAFILLIDFLKLYVVAAAAAVIAALTGVIMFTALPKWEPLVIFLEMLKENVLIKVIALIFIAAVALYISQHFFVMRFLVCAGYWGSMIFLIHKDLFPVKQVMFFLVAELMFVLSEVLDRIYYRKEPERNKKMLALTPAVLILVIVLALLPYNKEPLKWSRTKRFINNISRSLELFMDGIKNWGEEIDEFAIGFTGYDEEEGIFGNKLELDSEALKLTMVGNEEHVYLTGNIKNKYIGNSWEGNPGNAEGYGDYKEYQLDAAEYLYALYRLGVMDNNTNVWYIHFRKMTVDYREIKTSSLFRPGKTISIYDMENKGEVMDEADNIKFSKNQNKKTSYNLSFFALNRGPEYMDGKLRELSRYKYDTLPDGEYNRFVRTIRLKYGGIVLPPTEDFEGLLKERAEYIRNNYLALPDTVTERTRALAYEITSECETDYDKMKAITEYLSAYEYTTNPGKMPDNQDIVDYLLFDSKRGYCTYFATAAAVLGRCVGIPTRYVQGYLLDVNRMESYGAYTVKEEQAHAWTECYLEGIGWLTFDATPGNSDFIYQEWDVPAYITGEKSDTENKPSEILTDEDEEEDELLTDVDLIEKKENEAEVHKNVFTVIFGAVVLFIVIWLIYLKVCEKIFWHCYRSADNAGKVKTDVIMIIWIMERAGYTMRDGETIKKYFDRMKAVYTDKTVVLDNVCNIYMQLRYGKSHGITKEEQRTAQRLRLNLMDKTVNERLMARQCLVKMKNK